MRIRPPNNPDVLTYRDTVVYAPDRILLEQRRLSSSITPNGSWVDTHFLTLTILRLNIDDEGRYVCSRGKTIFAEYDLLIIGKCILNSFFFVEQDCGYHSFLVPPQFIDDNDFNQQRTIIEGSTLQLSCAAHGRPRPSISWLYSTTNNKHVLCE